MAQRDYYDILGVPRDADKKTLKDAYHRLAMKWHPDRNKAPDAEDRFKEIAKAYAVLSDPKKRARYDASGEEGVAHSGVELRRDARPGVGDADMDTLIVGVETHDHESAFRLGTHGVGHEVAQRLAKLDAVAGEGAGRDLGADLVLDTLAGIAAAELEGLFDPVAGLNGLEIEALGAGEGEQGRDDRVALIDCGDDRPGPAALDRVLVSALLEQ